MADGIGIASGVLALAMFAFKQSKSLYQTLHSYSERHTVVQEICAELDALSTVLGSVQKATSKGGEDLSLLKDLLLRSGNSCEDFRAFIKKETRHSQKSKGLSWRDWGNLQYKDENINGFKSKLATYRGLLTLGLSDAMFRTVQATHGQISTNKVIFDDFQANTAKSDASLKVQIENLVDRIEELASQNSEKARLEKRDVEKELTSLKASHQICERAVETAKLVKVHTYEDVKSDHHSNLVITAEDGTLITAKNVTAVNGSNMMLGNLSMDAVVKSLEGLRGSVSGAQRLKDKADEEAASKFVSYGTGHVVGLRR